MANNLIIAYELNPSNKSYDKIFEAIRLLGSSVKVQNSLWYVSSDLSVSEVRDRLKSVIDDTDSLIVIDSKNNTVAWYGIDDMATDHMKKNWPG